MRVQLRNNPSRQFDLPSDIADLFLLWPGSPVERIGAPAPRKLEPRTKWGAGYVSGNYGDDRLCIVARCENCKKSMQWEGRDVDFNLDRNKFWHCGTGEVPPLDIRKQYMKFFRRNEEQTPADPSENPMVRLFSGSRRDDESTTYETGDPQPI